MENTVEIPVQDIGDMIEYCDNNIKNLEEEILRYKKFRTNLEKYIDADKVVIKVK